MSQKNDLEFLEYCVSQLEAGKELTPEERERLDGIVEEFLKALGAFRDALQTYVVPALVEFGNRLTEALKAISVQPRSTEVFINPYTSEPLERNIAARREPPYPPYAG